MEARYEPDRSVDYNMSKEYNVPDPDESEQQASRGLINPSGKPQPQPYLRSQDRKPQASRLHMLDLTIRVLTLLTALSTLALVGNVLSVYGITRNVNEWSNHNDKLFNIWPKYLVMRPILILLGAAAAGLSLTASLLAGSLFRMYRKDTTSQRLLSTLCQVLAAALWLTSAVYNRIQDNGKMTWDFLTWTCSSHHSNEQINMAQLCLESRIAISSAFALGGFEIASLVMVILVARLEKRGSRDAQRFKKTQYQSLGA